MISLFLFKKKKSGFSTCYIDIVNWRPYHKIIKLLRHFLKKKLHVFSQRIQMICNKTNIDIYSKVLFISAKWHNKVAKVLKCSIIDLTSLKAVYVFFPLSVKMQPLSVLCYPHQKFTHKYLKFHSCFLFDSLQSLNLCKI